jgi:ComF family protein
MNRIRLLTRQVVTVALDLLFPPHCVSCERVGSFLCERCLATITPAPTRVLQGLDGVCVHGNFEGALSSAVHALKYDKCVRMADSLGTLLIRTLEETDWHVDMVTAVPLHESRLRERGYNQAGLLASTVAQHYHWAFVPGAVARIRETASQVHLNAQERRGNVAGAFKADCTVVSGRHVLIIDDVLTTGSTLAACAEALRAAGAERVYGAAVASAVFSGAGVPDAPVP